MNPIGLVRRASMLMLLAAAACDGDGGTGPASPASMVAITATTQRVPVATPVPVPPTVLVSDRHGRALAGVEVTFAVTSGNGTVAATSRTDAGGMAVASGWTTGTAAVENVLTASVPGLAPVLFRVTALSGPAAALEKAGGDAQSAAVGSVLVDSLSVRVVDAYGNGVPDVPVDFVATNGLLSASRVVTGALGHARVSLTLPTRPGIVQVRAASGLMTPQAFGITVTSGPPAAIARMGGDGQRAHSGTAVPVAPTVRVTDRFGNPVGGQAVTFTPAIGSGTVTDGAAVTAADGRAAVGRWVLGDTGTNRLIVRVAGLDSLVFTATSLEPCGSRTYTLLSTLTDVLHPERCRVGSRNAEVYSFTVASTQCLQFRMNSSDFDTYLYLLDSSGAILAEDDDSGGSLNSLIRSRLSAGSYSLGAAGWSGGTGSFELVSSVAADAECGYPASSGISPAKTSR